MKLALASCNGVQFTSSFRSKATLLVALTAIIFLVPVTCFYYFTGNWYISTGFLTIIALLGVIAQQVAHCRCYQNTVTFALIPVTLVLIAGMFETGSEQASLWCFPCIAVCYIMLETRRALMANLCIVALCLPLIASYLTIKDAVPVGSTLIGISVFFAIMVYAIDEFHDSLQLQASKDSLTGLYNRVSLQARLEKSITQCRNSQSSASILAIDIDHFKKVNDKYGHDVGDQVLIAIARHIETITTLDNHAFRIGGEEFLLLLSRCNERQANTIAERLRHEIASSELLPEDAVTISIGMATCQQGDTWQSWLKHADNQLYIAKRLGRNRVSFTKPAPTLELPGTFELASTLQH